MIRSDDPGDGPVTDPLSTPAGRAHPPAFRGAQMSKDDLLQISGRVTELMAGGYFRITGDNGRQFVARISGRLRRLRSPGFSKRACRLMSSRRPSLKMSRLNTRIAASIPRPSSTTVSVCPRRAYS